MSSIEHDIADLNRATWSQPAAIEEFFAEGFVDPGERAAFVTVAPRVRGQPALDIGVGPGRTVPLMRLMTDDYVAVDFVPAMVEVCRRRHPAIDVRTGDVRNLSVFDEGRFGLVLFSFNGIDSLGHEDRQRALREVFRVTRRGGWFMFSTHNLDGPSHHEVPWRGSPFAGPRWYRALRWTARLPLNLPRYARRWSNWWRHRSMNREGDGWSVCAAALHEFGTVLHYVTLDALLAEVTAAGFCAIEVFESEHGTRISRGDDTRHVNAFHVIAQRPVARRLSTPQPHSTHSAHPAGQRLHLVS